MLCSQTTFSSYHLFLSSPLFAGISDSLSSIFTNVWSILWRGNLHFREKDLVCGGCAPPSRSDDTCQSVQCVFPAAVSRVADPVRLLPNNNVVITVCDFCLCNILLDFSLPIPREMKWMEKNLYSNNYTTGMPEKIRQSYETRLFHFFFVWGNPYIQETTKHEETLIFKDLNNLTMLSRCRA